jgi:hypothetical protein
VRHRARQRVTIAAGSWSFSVTAGVVVSGTRFRFPRAER